MVEKEMQELLWRYPLQLLHEPLQQFKWEISSDVGRADLVFEDRHGRLLVVEVKRGKLPRGAIDQLLDYFGMMKQKFPGKPVELMVVANVIPQERQLACENRDIECRAISEKTFRDVAAEVGYTFGSESKVAIPPEAHLRPSRGPDAVNRKEAGSWAYSRAVQSPSDVQDFLSRCDEEGNRFFAALFEAQKDASSQTKITWDHQSGFSMQFYFPRVGFAPVVWGFPARNRDGKSIRQRLDFPFDFSVRAGVPETFVDEFGAALCSLVPFSGGGKRPSIPVAAFQSEQAAKVIETIFEFAVRAKSSTK
ncbi:MAG TPA: endonuclease NucS domain-containing protein [Bryobacteraceae bacterium]|jgi:hypothetical protein|nr:endonuclease NucS domain-containing protein [Bryobacteraceae bacterium]